MALLKFSKLLDLENDDFSAQEAANLTEAQEDILRENSKYFLLCGGSLTAEEMCWLTTIERVSLYLAKQEIDEEKTIFDEQARRLEDEDIGKLAEPKPERLTEEDKIATLILSGALGKVNERMAAITTS